MFDEAAHVEHEAWGDVVADLRKLGVEINEKRCNPLVTSICHWGERLVGLRIGQSVDMRENARARVEKEYTCQH